MTRHHHFSTYIFLLFWLLVFDSFLSGWFVVGFFELICLDVKRHLWFEWEVFFRVAKSLTSHNSVFACIYVFTSFSVFSFFSLTISLIFRPMMQFFSIWILTATWNIFAYVPTVSRVFYNCFRLSIANAFTCQFECGGCSCVYWQQFIPGNEPV